MLECSMAFIQDIYTNFTRSGLVADRFQRIMRSQCFAFACADGALMMVHLSTTEKFWLEFLAALDAGDLARDERFADHAMRVRNYPALAGILCGIIKERPRAEWIARFETRDVPFAPIQSVAEAAVDPQTAFLEAMETMIHPEQGEVKAVACPVRVDGARPRPENLAPPMLGEHTAEVLAELGSPRPVVD